VGAICVLALSASEQHYVESLVVTRLGGTENFHFLPIINTKVIFALFSRLKGALLSFFHRAEGIIIVISAPMIF